MLSLLRPKVQFKNYVFSIFKTNKRIQNKSTNEFIRQQLLNFLKTGAENIISVN